MLVAEFEQMDFVVQSMGEFQRGVTEMLEDIDNAMKALRSSWHGDGSDEQARAQQQWEDGAEQMQTSLTQLQKAVEAARKNYSDAVTKNGEMWGE